MRSLIMLGMTVALVAGAVVPAEDKKPPEKLVFRSKAGDVTFDHAAHLKREKGECMACHDKLWPQSSKTPLKGSTGCRTCHHQDGKSFETKNNCVRCHPPAAGKS
jgi:c(7)-type cytochrome triheme protein